MAEKIVKDSQGLAKDLVNDTISRQAAIDGFYEMASDMDYLCTVSDYVSFLESLPSAQPERKRGKWIKVNGKTAINCSACYHCSWSLSFEDTVKRFNYCPQCGADMQEVDDE